MTMSTNPEVKEDVGAPPRSAWYNTPALQIPILILLFTVAAAYESVHLSALTSVDVGVHLRTGYWILQNHAIPRQGLFSQYPGSTWIASSWAYAALLAVAHKLMGLRALPVLLMVMEVGIAIVTFLLARGWRGNFWLAVLLSAASQCAITDLQPAPLTCSIVFYGIELILLFRSHRTRSTKPLFWLPCLFLLWANLHIQFLNGLCVLALFLLAETVEHFIHRSGHLWREDYTPIYSPGLFGAILGLSVFATVLTPYSVHLIPEALSDAYSKIAFQYHAEMHPMNFRRPQDFMLLLLLMTAFFALGRQRSLSLFKLGLITIGTLIALRITRDGWFAVLPAIAVIADAVDGEESSSQLPEGERYRIRSVALAVGVPVLAVLVIAGIRIPATGNVLMDRAATRLPVKACDFIRDNHLPGPLFNSEDWGGFLTWYLPEYPVAMDRRLGLYGEEASEEYFETTDGRNLQAAPTFTGARTILLPKSAGLARALSTFPGLTAHYRVLYNDDIAMVLERQE